MFTASDLQEPAPVATAPVVVHHDVTSSDAMYANRQIVEEKAAAAAMVGGAPQPSAATFAPEIAVPQPQPPAVAAQSAASSSKPCQRGSVALRPTGLTSRFGLRWTPYASSRIKDND